MAWYGIGPSLSLAWLPIVVVVHLALTLSLGLLLAMANLYYRDVKYLFEVFISAWMFATSVLYPIDCVVGEWSALYYLNPMNAIIDGYRRAILLGASPMSSAFAGSAVFTFLLLAWSWWFFHRAEPGFAENV